MTLIVIVGFVLIANRIPEKKPMTPTEIAHEKDIAEILKLHSRVRDYTLGHGETPQEFACRVHTKLIDVEAFAYAIEKNGGTVEGALSSLSRFSDKLGSTCEDTQ